VVLLINPAQKPGPWQQTEWTAAVEECWRDPSKKLVSVLLGDGQLPGFLSNRQVIRVSNIPKQWRQAVEAVIRVLRGEKPQDEGLVSTEVEDPSRRRDRLKYIEEVARAMKSK